MVRNNSKNPKNLEITLIDFGLSSRLHKSGGVGRTLHTVVGSPYYLAPEVLGRSYDD